MDLRVISYPRGEGATSLTSMELMCRPWFLCSLCFSFPYRF